ncbi:hypothetical protein H0H93_012683, partial [Arthromyces matolae]
MGLAAVVPTLVLQATPNQASNPQPFVTTSSHESSVSRPTPGIIPYINSSTTLTSSLSSETTPLSTDTTTLISTPTSNSLNGTPQATAIPNSSQSSSQHGLPAGVIAGIVIAIVAVISLVAGLSLFLMRRRSQGRAGTSINDTFAPVGGNTLSIRDPFLTDAQAKTLGVDASQRTTRRIRANFLSFDYSSQIHGTISHPQILVTHDDDGHAEIPPAHPLTP